MKTQDKFTQHSDLHNGSLTTEAMDDESITVRIHQTIEERDEQERASDLTKFRSTRTRALSGQLRLQAKRMLLIIPSTRAQVLKMNVDYNQIVL
jgi:hypothetical protein